MMSSSCAPAAPARSRIVQVLLELERIVRAGESERERERVVYIYIYARACGDNNSVVDEIA